MIIAAERLIQRQGDGPLVLSKLVGDFLPLMRDEGMTMPPDLLLIFKALVTVDGVLAGIEPGFDLSKAMRRSSLWIVQARLSPERLNTTLQALLWELAKIGDDAPKLVRAAVRRLEASSVEDPAGLSSADFLSGARLLAAAILASGAAIALSEWMP